MQVLNNMIANAAFSPIFDADSDTKMSVINCSGSANSTGICITPMAGIQSPLIMAFMGILGNAIAIAVLHRNLRREQTRTVFYVLVYNLAWTDLMGIVMTTIPVLLVYVHGKWVGGRGLCNFHAFAMITFGMITPAIVATMAVERYVGIRHAYFYKRLVNQSLARRVLVAHWGVVLLFASLPFFGFGRYQLQFPKTWCFLNLHPETSVESAYATLFALLNLVVITITNGCNIIVTASLLRMRNRRKHLGSPTDDRFPNFPHHVRQREIEIQMVVLLMGVTIVFTVCWAPLMIQILANQVSDHGSNHKQDLIAVRLASINQTFDPWVYILFRKVIFTKVWSLFRRVFSVRGFSTRRQSSKDEQPAEEMKSLGPCSEKPPPCIVIKTESPQPDAQKLHLLDSDLCRSTDGLPTKCCGVCSTKLVTAVSAPTLLMPLHNKYLREGRLLRSQSTQTTPGIVQDQPFRF